MNFAVISTLRSVINTYRRNALMVIVPYSTAVNTQVQEEPDKLYKRIEVEMRANEPATMKSYTEFAKMAADHLRINVGLCYAAFKPVFYRDELTLLRSAFAKKKYRVQYEVRTYFRYMNFHYLTGSTADTLLEYLQRNLPEGVALKITKVAVEKLPEDITSPKEQGKSETAETSADNVEQ